MEIWQTGTAPLTLFSVKLDPFIVLKIQVHPQDGFIEITKCRSDENSYVLLVKGVHYL